jgi:serine/threonine protein kinase
VKFRLANSACPERSQGDTSDPTGAESGRALLTAFGVAKALGGGEIMTSAASVVGTPSYMSPEQAAGRADIDGRSDIYSLGVMGYAMLTGRLPFEGKTAGATSSPSTSRRSRRRCAHWRRSCPTPWCRRSSAAWRRIPPSDGRMRAR